MAVTPCVRIVVVTTSIGPLNFYKKHATRKIGMQQREQVSCTEVVSREHSTMEVGQVHPISPNAIGTWYLVFSFMHTTLSPLPPAFGLSVGYFPKPKPPYFFGRSCQRPLGDPCTNHSLARTPSSSPPQPNTSLFLFGKESSDNPHLCNCRLKPCVFLYFYICSVLWAKRKKRGLCAQHVVIFCSHSCFLRILQVPSPQSH